MPDIAATRTPGRLTWFRLACSLFVWPRSRFRCSDSDQVAKGVQGGDRMESVPDSPWLPDMGSHPSRPQGSPAGTTDSIPSPSVLRPDGRPDATVHVRGMCDDEAGIALPADGGHPRQRLLVGVGTRGRLAPRQL